MLPRPPLRAVFLAACIAAGGALPAIGWTQASRSPAMPAVDALEVNADAGFQPGSTLDFTVRGTPGAQARVQVTGTPIDVQLRESSPGRYTGSYTVRRTDRLDARALIRARVLANGRSASSDFSFPASFAQQQAAPEQQMASQQASTTTAVKPPPPPASRVRIDRFEAAPVQRIEPGAQLRFMVEGVPGATVTVDWPGLQGALLLREEQPGRYAGTYTLRSQDTVNPGPVVATLSSGGRRVTAQLATPLVAASPSPAPSSSMGAAAPPMLALQLTSPPPNSAANGGQVLLQGRTSPGAMVHVRIDAVPPAPPGRMAVAQPVTLQTVQADANGQFSLNIDPRRAAPGTRFDVQVYATQGGQATPEQRLVFFQQAG